MNVSDLLNPLENIAIAHSSQSRRSRCVSTPVLSPYSHKAPSTKRVQEQRVEEAVLVSYGYQYQQSHQSHQQQQQQQLHHHHQNIGKPRSRFSEAEDNIICDGVAQGLTWGQISELLPHRKRATCFNRYRTLQGIRKSRKNSTSLECNNNNTDYYSGPVTPPLAPLNTANTNAPPPLVSPPTKYNCYPSTSPFDAIYSKKNYQMTSSPPVHHSQQDSYPSEISSCSSESSSDEELYYHHQHHHHPRPHRVSLPAFSCPPFKHS